MGGGAVWNGGLHNLLIKEGVFENWGLDDHVSFPTLGGTEEIHYLLFVALCCFLMDIKKVFEK